MPLSRREFLRHGAVFLGAGTLLPSFVWRTAAAAELGAAGALGDRIIVLVQLAGGNDGLNTVIPYADPLYYQYRRRLGIPKAEVLALDASVGLHPSLEPLKGHFDAKRLAVVQGVGYPKANRSHFIATDIWHTASPEDPAGTGWLGRYHDQSPTPPGLAFKGLSLGGQLPSLFKSVRSPVPALREINDFRFFPKESDAQRANDLRTFVGLQEDANPAMAKAAWLQEQTLQAWQASENLRQQINAWRSRVTYPNNGLARQLQQIAQIIASPLGIRSFHASQGGYDTHANQGPGHARLLGDLAQALRAFMSDLEAMGKADKVVVMTYSEFGRRVVENGSVGTDHGAASCLFVLGHPVAGGVHGAHPPMAEEELDHGDLAWKIDFRQVYAGLLEGWLGCPSDAVLGRKFTPLPLIRDAASG